MSATQGDLGATRGPGGNEPPAGFLAWWRRRSAMRRAHLEARHLLKEARRILRRRGQQIPGAVTSTVRSAIQAVDDAIAAGDVERIRKANATLDEVMDDHLSFARKSTLREYAESIGVAIAVALLLRAFVVEAFQIPSGSMIPTLEVGDHIFVSKFSYGLSIPFTDTKILQYGTPERGDVIVFKFPQDHSTDYIKRVVGLPGDTVEVRQGQLYVNGQEVRRERLRMPCHYSEVSNAGVPDDHDCEHWVETLGNKVHDTILEPSHPAIDQPRTVIAPNEVFVMGDNRDNSYDSRKWGTVNMSLIKGRALIIWWSRGNSKQWDPVSWMQAIRWKRFFTVVH
jgi:signal peptidase I